MKFWGSKGGIKSVDQYTPSPQTMPRNRALRKWRCPELAPSGSCVTCANRVRCVIVLQVVRVFGHYVIDQVREKVNKKLAAERPDVDTQIAHIDTQRRDVQTRLDRYFEAFETGKLSPALCNDKVEALTKRLEQLDGEKTAFEERRELPVVDHSKIGDLIDNFEDVLASGTNPQKKHLVGLLVKDVKVHNRDKIEVWYQVPNPQRFEHWNKWLRGQDSNLRYPR